MHIRKITVRNYRLLKDFSIDLEEIMSLIVGKNNSGKTSLLQLLNTMLNGTEPTYNDLNLDYRRVLWELISASEEAKEEDYTEDGISLRLFIEYGEADNLDCLGKILMDLDENIHTAVIGFDYYLGYANYVNLRKDCRERSAKKKARIKDKTKVNDDKLLRNEFDYLLSKQLGNYFKLTRKSIEFDKDSNQPNEKNYIDLKKRVDFRLDDLISFGYIDARRNVANVQKDSTLSGQTSTLFERMNESTATESIENFEQLLISTDEELTSQYRDIFSDIISQVAQMGGMKPNETKIKIISTLQQRELLKGNTTVVYDHNNSDLPEHYNGLGYMNLISMIFQIEIIRQSFLSNKKSRMSDINLLIIEEPEAHTHPQMQYIFIKNIKDFLKAPLDKDEKKGRVQSIISTHSSHIVSESDFDDIKYMLRTGNNEVKAKNMKDLRVEYDGDDKQYYTFLKHYLTLNRSELFFADKAIFIEGDTERILIPTMMKKLDQEEPLANDEIPLTQQNISIVEVGAYSHVFGKFINFIGLKKALVITDLDICDQPDNGHTKKERYKAGTNQITSNNAIKNYFEEKDIDKLLALSPSDKTFTWDDKNKRWKKNPDGNMKVYFQVEEDGYQARSFEDGFIHINQSFIRENKETIIGLNLKKMDAFLGEGDKAIDAYTLAEDGIGSKATFAVEIIYLSKKEGNKDFCGWRIPQYIKEGLLWLRK